MRGVEMKYRIRLNANTSVKVKKKRKKEKRYMSPFFFENKERETSSRCMGRPRNSIASTLRRVAARALRPPALTFSALGSWKLSACVRAFPCLCPPGVQVINAFLFFFLVVFTRLAFMDVARPSDRCSTPLAILQGPPPSS